MKRENRMDTPPITHLNPDVLRSAMRTWSAGVTVVTSLYEKEKYGMTVNSFASISLRPALITVSLQHGTRTHDLVLKSQVLAVTILSAAQNQISDLFSGRFPEIADRLATVPTETLQTGAPFIVGGLAWLDCHVVQTYDTGSSTLIVAEVLAVREFSGEPLLYHNRQYGSFLAKSS